MKEKILNIIAITIIVIFCVAVITIFIVGLIVDPKFTLIGLSFFIWFLAFAWAAFRLGKIRAQREINKKGRTYILRDDN